MEDTKQCRLNDYAGKIIRYKARQLIGKYGFNQDDYEDLRQEMTLDILQRLPKFDATKAGMNTFVSRIIDHKISTIIRHRTQGKRDYRRACSLDEPIEDENGASVTRGEMLSQDDHDLHAGKHTRPESARTEIRAVISLTISELPPELRYLAELLLARSITQAAEELGVPRSTLYETGIAQLRKTFEDRGLRKYL